jgi:hypothetical protein
VWRRRLLVLSVVLAQALVTHACRGRFASIIELNNLSRQELTYVAEERDHDALGGAPPEVVLRPQSQQEWIVDPDSCLEGTVEARDADGNVVASWDQPCGRHVLVVHPPDD